MTLDLIFSLKDSGVSSFFDAFFYSFYSTIKIFILYINSKESFPDYFYVFVITQLVLIIIILVMAKGRFSLLLTFFLCLAVPLLGTLIIVGLLPSFETDEETKNKKKKTSVKSKEEEYKLCENCGKEIQNYYTKCPHCGHTFFEDEKDKDKIVI